MSRGLLIVFEGVDGGGKSTQLARLRARLEAAGRRVVSLREPSDGPVGQEIRARARDGPPLGAREELDLFVEDRRESVRTRVLPALARGDVVLQDRSFYSTAAYQTARAELGLTPADVVALHAGWVPRPDLVLLFDLPVGQGLARVERRGRKDAFEDPARQERVRATFLELAAADPASFRVVDAARGEDEVAAAVWAEVAPRLGGGGQEEAAR